ncbi:phosphatase [Escherichia coli]|nr:phosphatase [Escherichia coli]
MTIKNVICDIDGVLMHDNVAVPGAAEFLHGIMDKGPAAGVADQLSFADRARSGEPLATAGVDVPDSVFYTSAMATADFLRRQEGKKAYVVGEGALIHELYKAGFTITDVNPDFVIVGETRSYQLGHDGIKQPISSLTVHVLSPPTRTPTGAVFIRRVVRCVRGSKNLRT